MLGGGAEWDWEKAAMQKWCVSIANGRVGGAAGIRKVIRGDEDVVGCLRREEGEGTAAGEGWARVMEVGV